MKYVAGNLALWLIALAAVLMTTGALARVGPVFAICMIGSTLLVRKGVGLPSAKT